MSTTSDAPTKETQTELPHWIEASWPAPEGIRALTTTRIGGISVGDYASMNLATHVGDDPSAVAANRQKLMDDLELPSTPVWMNQVHGTDVADEAMLCRADAITADAAYSDQPDRVLAVMTADCLPVALVSHDGSEFALVHAGWRGLAGGVLERTIERFQAPTDQIMAWLGPAIGPEHFEVGAEVRDAFVEAFAGDAVAFRAVPGSDEAGEEKFLGNLYTLARARLRRLGLTRFYGGDRCTYAQSDLFYSHRRASQHGADTGRMATLIWHEAAN